MSNKITTLGYFVKRLRDSGYVVNKLYTDFSEMDSRRWTVVIDPDNASVFCTCYENDSKLLVIMNYMLNLLHVIKCSHIYYML